jgi:hypothetical protein
MIRAVTADLGGVILFQCSFGQIHSAPTGMTTDRLTRSSFLQPNDVLSSLMGSVRSLDQMPKSRRMSSLNQ